MTSRPLRVAPEPDDFSDLRKKLTNPGTTPTAGGSWKPLDEGEGAEIMGRVVAVSNVDGNYGTKPVLTIDTPSGERTVWASHKVLREELQDQPPALGSRILIRYDGTATSAAGHEYHVYSVAVDQTLNVAPDTNWVDVFNGVSTSPTHSVQTKPQTTDRPADQQRSSTGSVDTSDLPF